MAQKTREQRINSAKAMSKQISQTFNRLTRETVKYTNHDPTKCKERLNSILTKMETYIENDDVLGDKTNWDLDTCALYTTFVSDAKASFDKIAIVMSKHAKYKKDPTKNISILSNQCPDMILCNRIFSMKLQCHILQKIADIDCKTTQFTVWYI